MIPPGRVLLDTHMLLWSLLEPERLPPLARDLLGSDGAEEVLYSVASIWEIAIKVSLRRPSFTYRPERVAERAALQGFVELRVTTPVASRVADLPYHHRDPFDRLIVAHALHLLARLFTADAALRAYSTEAVAPTPWRRQSVLGREPAFSPPEHGDDVPI